MSKSRAKAPATPSVKKRLVALLRADHKAGNLVRTRNRRVSREHYAELLGCHPHYLGKVAAEEFKRYDQSYAEDLLVEATLFLEAATANKTLRTRDKQINRTWLLDALNAPQRSMTLWPRFRELVESYDQKIADGQYVTPKSESLDLRFTKLLNSPQRPLGKDGLSINATALARAIGIYPFQLRVPHFNDQIAAMDARLKRGEFLLPGQAIIGNRLFDVRVLMPHFNEAFLDRLNRAFKSYADTLHGGAPRERSLIKRLFGFIAEKSESHFTSVRDSLNAGRHPTVPDWEKCVDAFLHHREQGFDPHQHRTKYNERGAVNRLLRHFASVGLTPILYKRVRSHRPKGMNLRRTKTRTIADIVASNDTGADASISHEVRKLANSILSTALHPDEYDEPETVRFLTVLEQEAFAIEGLLPKDVPSAVLAVINRRLGAISDAVNVRLNEAKELLENGEALLSSATLTKQSLEQMVAIDDPSRQREICKEWFPPISTSEGERIAKANLLSFSVIELGGVLPSQLHVSRTIAPGLNIKALVSLTTRLGGRRKLNDLLIPNAGAISAAITDILARAGTNIAVATSYRKDCIRPSKTRGFVELVGNKDRAGGKAIVSEFRRNSNLHKNVEWVRESTSRISSLAPENERDSLFLIVKGPVSGAITASRFRDEFKRFIATIPSLKGLPLLPGMLRRSVVVKVSLETAGASQVAAAAANHSPRVSRAYSNTMPVLLQAELRMLEYIYHYESLIVIEASQHAPLTGYPKEEVERRFETLRSTGLGTLCKDPFNKPGSEGKQCADPTSCAKDKCPQMVVRLNPIEVARMQLWKPALLKAEPDWERDYPERWRTTWLPWLCLIVVVERKASRGAFLDAWDAGTELREEMEQRPNFRSPQPW